jgi:lysophospholipase L1-like esterase
MLLVIEVLFSLLLFWFLYEVVRLLWYVHGAIELGKKAGFFSEDFDPKAKNILVIGDSTTYGTGVSDKTKSLPGRLAVDMPEYHVVNLSESAMSLKRLCEKLDTIQGRYASVFIHIGGVDTFSFTPLSTVRTRVTDAVVKAKRLARGKVFLVSVNNPAAVPAYRFPLANLFGARSRHVSVICGEVCSREGIAHVPLWVPREQDPLSRDPDRLVARDLMHPNDEGYGVWYEKIHAVLRV